ncbi:MAG: hypothetical protein AAGA67_07960 [Cyanobacteria bacterium P01_F01_bin.153]
MSSGIYLVRDDGRLVEMVEQSYGSEALLEELLELYPNLLNGERVDREALDEWLVIIRQDGGGFEDSRTDLWASNRIFLDRDAVPTLVEIDCSVDPQIRQGTVGHLLTAAASVSLNWPVESILTQFEANCREVDRDPEQVFEAFLGHDQDEERFWQQVKTNLQAGRIRLVLVSDQVSDELSRMIEFLNEQMDPAELVAIEIKQYAGQGEDDGLKTLVPRAIGRTAEANKKKSATNLERRRWDEKSFFQEMELRQTENEVEVARTLYDWCCNHRSLEVHWRTGDTYGGFVAVYEGNRGVGHELFKIGIDGGFEIMSQHYANWEPFDSRDEWDLLRARLSEVGLALPENRDVGRSPNFSLSTLKDPTAFDKVLEVFDWVIGRVQEYYR